MFAVLQKALIKVQKHCLAERVFLDCSHFWHEQILLKKFIIFFLIKMEPKCLMPGFIGALKKGFE